VIGDNFKIRVSSTKNWGSVYDYSDNYFSLGTANPVVSIVASDADAGEPANNGEFRVSRTGSTTGSLRVYYGTSGSTSTAGSDYAALSGYADIPSGQASTPIPVDVIDDSLVEDSETVKVTISSNSAYDIDPSKSYAIATIADDDQWSFAIKVDTQDEAKMAEYYHVNLEISAPDTWPGGDISVVVEEERGPVHATWDIHDNEYWYSWIIGGEWRQRPEAKCTVYVYDDVSGQWILRDDDYKFGVESISLNLGPGEKGYCYLGCYHRWFWIPPWNWTRIGDIIVSLGLGQIVPGGGAAYSVGKKLGQALYGQEEIMYTYRAICKGTESQDATLVKVPVEKYILLGESMGFSVEASIATSLGTGLLLTPEPTTATKWAAAVAFVAEGISIISGEGAYANASDPPDFNYTEVAMPQIPDIPELSQIEDPNHLEAAKKFVELAATRIALKISMERYEGAKIDGQPEYMALQIEAAKSYSQRVAELTDWLSKFWGHISGGLPIPTPQQIQEAREKLLQDGLPELEVSILSAFEYSPEKMTEIAQSVASLPDEYFTSPGKVSDGLSLIADSAAEVHRYISGPNSVDEFINLSVEHIGYDHQTHRFGVDVTVTNTSTIAIATPVWLVIKSTSDPLVMIAENDGKSNDGKDYVDLFELLDDGHLAPLESISKRIYFNNPEGVRFTFEPSVRGVILSQGEGSKGGMANLARLSEHWLGDEPTLDVAPSGGDGIINLRDFAVLAEHWLEKH
jgi:hypothetical protein